jgi:carbamoyltransferase
MDLARSIQAVTEEIILKLARSLQAETGEKNLCLAGGVALNCVANGRLQREKIFERVWVQPAAGDAGGALGAAYAGWHQFAGAPRAADGNDRMLAALLGPGFSAEEAIAELKTMNAVVTRLPGDELAERVSQVLAEGKVVGWFQGRMEFGPRALGARSILADPRDPAMQSKLNLKIKHREEFRPFAPAVLAENAGEYFALDCPSPYMEFVATVKQKLPAITHVDQSARIQTVHAATNPRFHHLLEKFRARTGCGVLVNTSFNVRGEPIVCTPADAYRCFMRTDIDYLVIEDLLLEKSEQPAPPTGPAEEFEPD